MTAEASAYAVQTDALHGSLRKSSAISTPLYLSICLECYEYMYAATEAWYASILMLGAAAGVPLLQKQPLTQRVLVRSPPNPIILQNVICF